MEGAGGGEGLGLSPRSRPGGWASWSRKLRSKSPDGTCRGRGPSLCGAGLGARGQPGDVRGHVRVTGEGPHVHLEWTRRGRGRALRALRIQSMAGVLSISQEERVASCEQKIKAETRFNVLLFMRLNIHVTLPIPPEAKPGCTECAASHACGQPKERGVVFLSHPPLSKELFSVSSAVRLVNTHTRHV